MRHILLMTTAVKTSWQQPRRVFYFINPEILLTSDDTIANLFTLSVPFFTKKIDNSNNLTTTVKIKNNLERDDDKQYVPVSRGISPIHEFHPYGNLSVAPKLCPGSKSIYIHF